MVTRKVVAIAVAVPFVRRVEAMSPSPLARRMIVDAAIERAMYAEIARLRKIDDERRRKQSKKMGWSW